MKKFSYIHACLIAVSLFLFWGCEESPKPQVSEAYQALEEARKAGAADVAPELLAQAEDYLQRAADELHVQDEQFGPLRNYSEAKSLLGQATDTAVQARSKGVARGVEQARSTSEEAKEEVIRAMTAARVALKEVKELLTMAPEGKDAELVLEIMENDVYSAESTLAEIPGEVTPRDYAMVKEKATEVEAVTTRIREQILQAMRKTEAAMP
ncbi:MAG: hypothetical protein ACPGYT_02980 [Nitrospirales bacterium]